LDVDRLLASAASKRLPPEASSSTPAFEVMADDALR